MKLAGFRSLIVLIIFVQPILLAGEPPQKLDELRIGLSTGAAKEARGSAAIERFALVASGDADARLSWDSLSAEERSDTLAAVIWSKADPALREKAIRRLARISPSADKNGQSVAALSVVAVSEGDGSLRALARKALAARDDKRTADVLVSALRLEDPLLRTNVVAAMREIGGPRVFEVIVEHWKEIWGASPRDHVFIGTQRSYIADYDISGSSYDPVVKTFMTGVVLDAKVIKVEADVYYVWIREITGEHNIKNDPAAWERWIEKEKPRLVRQAEETRAQAAKYFEQDAAR